MNRKQTDKKRIAILGSTGSIGTQTLDVISRHPDRFEVALLTANNRVEELAAQAVRFGAARAVICNAGRYDRLVSLLHGTPVEALSGMDAVCEAVADPSIDIVVTSMVGFSGLAPTLAAIRAGKTIALANKETLVAAGAAVTSLARGKGVEILPVDSEHSAIFQCLMGAGDNHVRRLHLTASGGPFRTWSRDRIASATRAEALRHPNWSMGDKITVDSATMMNKGFEVIEARWLFDVGADRINVVVHPESIIHSMVEFDDGAVIAQLGAPDMREPIQFALSFPERLGLDNRKLDFGALGSLTFSSPDLTRFPCLALAFKALDRGGNIPCAMNAANEAAVDAFLHDRIGFYDIADTVSAVMEGTPFIAAPSVDDIFSTNSEALVSARAIIDKIASR